MCGIVGYIGTEQAAPIILDGLSKLEYRGYDSAGMAIFDGEKINTRKAVGRLKVLENLTHGGENMKGTSGIGHTRWATHGAPSDINSHPHMNNAGTIAVVHNGIIENYIPLKKKMQDKGYQFVSETDTEVLAHLLDYYYKGNPLEAITKVLHRVEGSYALGIMFADQPDKIFAARKDSPLIVGKSDNGSFIASDVPAILKYTRTVYYVDNQEVVELQQGSLRFFSVDEEEIEKQPVTIDWDANAAEKAGYEHFMLKEIYEQPKTINDTISPRIKDNDIAIEELNMSDEEIKEITKIHIVACGSAYHTGVTAKYVIEGLARIPVEVDVASEFRYRDPILQKGNMVIVISQSGETADTLAALRESRERGFKVLGIVNVVGSSIAREADSVMYTWAGPEIAVATTKAYSAQLTALYMLAMKFARVRGTIDMHRHGGQIGNAGQGFVQHARLSVGVEQPLFAVRGLTRFDVIQPLPCQRRLHGKAVRRNRKFLHGAGVFRRVIRRCFRPKRIVRTACDHTAGQDGSAGIRQQCGAHRHPLRLRAGQSVLRSRDADGNAGNSLLRLPCRCLGAGGLRFRQRFFFAGSAHEKDQHCQYERTESLHCSVLLRFTFVDLS